MLKKIGSCLLVAFMTLSISFIQVHALNSDHFEYTIENNEASVTGYKGRYEENLKIPSEINGYKVRVRRRKIGEAISKLSKKKQDIILLSFFLDMSEADIARYMKLGQSTVHYHKANSLKELKKLMEEKQSERNK